MEYNFTISGRIPSKKNNKQIISVRGRPMIISSKDYSDWHKVAIKSLQTQKMPPRRLETCEAVHISFWSENKRKWDLSNKAESIMDLLVDAGILVDDNYEVVPDLCLVYRGVDKSNPRCDIDIYVV